MGVVLRDGNLQVRIYTDDHTPPQVHVIGDSETKVDLGSPDAPPHVVRVIGARQRESARALRLVAGNVVLLRKKWIEIHG